MNKLGALKKTNNLISKKLKRLENSLNESRIYKAELLFELSNDETSLNVFFIKGGQKSEVTIEEQFQRIVCIQGEIKINIINSTHNEVITLHSSNTVFIPPQTNYTIESIIDSEIIIVYKPKKLVNMPIMITETIYNKV